jgi:uncharacterized phage protein gp47/JayE
MPGPYGVVATGFNPMTFSEIKAELEAAAQASFGANVDLAPETFLGQIIGTQAEREALIWDLMQAVYSAQDPDQANDAALEAICALTGTVRQAAEPSTLNAVAIGTNGTLLSSGRVASVTGTGSRFASTADATIATLSARVPGGTYAVGDLITGDSGKVYSCTTPITASDTAPTGTGTTIADDDGTWRYCGAGTAAVSVPLECEETGPKVAAAGTLTVIETPVGGWSTVVNPLDAELGSDLETNAALRIRREDELRANGTSPLESIRSDLLQVDNVTAVTVFENVGDATDGDGVPPHAVEALVLGGTDADIRAQLFTSVAAGIATHGTTSGTVTDSQGISHTVKFTRPTEVPVYVIVNVTVEAAAYPADGDDQITSALTAYGSTVRTGKDVVSAALSARAFSVPGVLDCTCLIGTAPTPTLTTTVAITPRQLATYDSSRVTVNATPGTP